MKKLPCDNEGNIIRLMAKLYGPDNYSKGLSDFYLTLGEIRSYLYKYTGKMDIRGTKFSLLSSPVGRLNKNRILFTIYYAKNAKWYIIDYKKVDKCKLSSKVKKHTAPMHWKILNPEVLIHKIIFYLYNTWF